MSSWRCILRVHRQDAKSAKASYDNPGRKADEETWARVRADYAEGLSPRMLAERHGLGERNIRRRAATEHWPRRGGRTLAEDYAPGEALEAFDSARRVEVNELLLRPTRQTLGKFAFRRATEAAAFGRPTEAAHWLRLVDQLRRNALAVDSAELRFEPADIIRAQYAEGLFFADHPELDPRADPEPLSVAADPAGVRPDSFPDRPYAPGRS